MPGSADAVAIDPGEFCALLKAVDRRPPRLSRDLEPDLVGIDLKHLILDALIAAPPDAADFESGLLERAAALDLPAGSARGICSDILAEWRMAHASPAFLPWLREEAARPLEPRRRRREERDGEPSWRPRPDRGFGMPPSDG
jgi:hypothetical protein